MRVLSLSFSFGLTDKTPLAPDVTVVHVITVVRVVVVVSVIAISRITVVPSVVTIGHGVVSVVSLVPVVILGISFSFGLTDVTPLTPEATVVVISVVAVSRITIVPSVVTIGHGVVSVVSLVPVVVLGISLSFRFGFSLTFSDSMNNTGRVSVVSPGFGAFLVNNWSITVNTWLINMVIGVDGIGQLRGFLSLFENLNIVSKGTSRGVGVIGNRFAFFTKDVFFRLGVVEFIFTLFFMSFTMLGFGKLDTVVRRNKSPV